MEMVSVVQVKISAYIRTIIVFVFVVLIIHRIDSVVVVIVFVVVASSVMNLIRVRNSMERERCHGNHLERGDERIVA